MTIGHILGPTHLLLVLAVALLVLGPSGYRRLDGGSARRRDFRGSPAADVGDEQLALE